jgi:cold shock CspA family protein/ribosome-associated translation inhibitor RaiA
MEMPPEIILRNVQMTPLIDKYINRGIARLEKVCDYIISAHIALEREQGRRQTGNPYRMRIDIRIPNRSDIVVNRQSKAAKKILEESSSIPVHIVSEGNVRTDTLETESIHARKVREEPLQALIRRTFDSARRELEKEVQKQRGELKTPAQQSTQAVVEKLFRDAGYGFLRTFDGQQVYFHQNSVLHSHWENLTVGTIVRYVPELGEKGLQASTVEIVSKPGVAEMHDQLHDLHVAP